MRFTRFGSAALGVALIAGLTACSSSSDSGTPAADTTASAEASTSAASGAATTVGDLGAIPSTKISVDYASPVQAQPGQQLFDVGAKQAAKLSGSAYSALDSNVDPSKQIANMTTMLQQKPDVIGTWTLDPGSTAGMYKQITDAKIPLVGTNSDDNGITSTVWTQGQICGDGGPADQDAKLIAKKYPAGKVITIGLDGVPSIDSQVKCFTGKAKAAGLDVVSHVSNSSDQAAGAQKLVTDLLVKYPDVKAVWAYNDASALGASAAILAAGKKISDGDSDGIMDFGSNGDDSAIQAVKEGRMTRSWDPNSVEFGWLFFAMAELAHEGKAPKAVVITSTGYDKSNVASWVTGKDRKITGFADLKYTIMN
ncbi:MAG: LacI family transcriptional regulator [Pseudonocardiales bacterium]|nr:LacI family transcriptional regulator [Pseudonocardiales bacterium]